MNPVRFPQLGWRTTAALLASAVCTSLVGCGSCTGSPNFPGRPGAGDNRKVIELNKAC
jgi:hypothetical protein